MTMQVSFTRVWRFQYPFLVLIVFHSSLFFKKARLLTRQRAAML